MFETVINLKPESEQWRAGDDHRQIDRRAGQSISSFRASRMPGPCRSRRASTCCPPVSARRSASRSSARTWARWRSWPGKSRRWSRQCLGTTSAFAERLTGASYLNIEPDRVALARYGLTVGELQDVIGTALGGEMVTTTVEGRERFGVTVRYPRELRSNPEQIAREVLVPIDGRRHGAAWANWPRSWWHAARRASAPRTRCSRPTSSSTSVAATSAATSPTRARRRDRPGEVPCQVTTSPGAVSSRAWSVPSRR
jgi:hypothetical protein